MAELAIHNIEGKETGTMTISDEILGGRVNTNLLHRAVTYYRASLRQGTLGVKDRHQVSGGGKKPFRQKGTGRARAGSSRSPLWHGGGVTFGPVARDFSQSLPKKMKRIAMIESLKAKYQGSQLVCLEDIELEMKKTKDFFQILKNLGLTRGKTLAILEGGNPGIERVTRNLARFHLLRSADVNAFDILQNKNLLVSKTALARLLERIEKSPVDVTKSATIKEIES
jgi:large subunit ribosomal protein L4